MYIEGKEKEKIKMLEKINNIEKDIIKLAKSCNDKDILKNVYGIGIENITEIKIDLDNLIINNNLINEDIKKINTIKIYLERILFNFNRPALF